MPTKAPELLPHGALVKRDLTNICGYVNGVSCTWTVSNSVLVAWLL